MLNAKLANIISLGQCFLHNEKYLAVIKNEKNIKLIIFIYRIDEEERNKFELQFKR